MAKPEILGTNLGILLAEFVGTFALAFAVLASVNGVLPSVATPVIAGITLGLAVLAIGGISGSHINPAVTVGMFSIGKIKGIQAALYVLVQILGAIVAVFTLDLLVESEILKLQIESGEWRVFFAELVGAALFTWGIAAATLNKLDKTSSALLVGGSLFLGIFFAATVSAGILNPAVATSLDALSWDYLLGPVVGAVIGMNLYKVVTENA